MKHRGFTRFVALISVICLTFSSINVYATTADTDDSLTVNTTDTTDETTDDADDSSEAGTTASTTSDESYTERIDHNYTHVSEKYTYADYTGKEVVDKVTD